MAGNGPVTEARQSGRAFFEHQQKRRKELQARLTGMPVTDEMPAAESVAVPEAGQRKPSQQAADSAPPKLPGQAKPSAPPRRASRTKPSAPLEPALQLVVTRGSNLGRVFGLHRGELIIGREAKSDIQLDDLTVSHNHALVRTHGELVTIEDLRSTNGTTVNGVAISRPVPVAPGDLIMVGAVELLIEHQGGQRKN
jgi:pSer/pThr/pTyr-binding forkhead associated (FHA) protein